MYKIAPKLKVIAKFGVGTDNIDKINARKRGIEVINARGANSNAVAEMIIGYIIDMLRGITSMHKSLEQGNWVRSLGHEVEGKTIGLIGFGAIAQSVAKKLQAFDANILAYDVCPCMTSAAKYGASIVPLEELLSKSDIISVHVPSTTETYHMLNDALFEKMKPGVYFINAARGEVIDTQALLRALESGRVVLAALDAFEEEPIKKDHPLLKSGKVICTPHTGGETYEAYRKVSICVAQGVIDVLNGKKSDYCVNP